MVTPLQNSAAESRDERIWKSIGLEHKNRLKQFMDYVAPGAGWQLRTGRCCTGMDHIRVMEISSRKIAYTGDAPKDGRRLMRVGGLAMCGWLQRGWLAWSMWFWCGSVRRRRRYLPRCKLPHELAPTSRAVGFLTSFPTAPIHFIFSAFLNLPVTVR